MGSGNFGRPAYKCQSWHQTQSTTHCTHRPRPYYHHHILPLDLKRRCRTKEGQMYRAGKRLEHSSSFDSWQFEVNFEESKRKIVSPPSLQLFPRASSLQNGPRFFSLFNVTTCTLYLWWRGTRRNESNNHHQWCPFLDWILPKSPLLYLFPIPTMTSHHQRSVK